MTPAHEIWPNFFIVGAPKCGTTSLYAALKSHPQVFLPELKEPHYFLDVPPPSAKVKVDHCAGDRQRYLSLYQNSGKFLAIGDASPSYLWYADAAAGIHKVSPSAKILIILRDPVFRAYSQFLMDPITGSTSRASFVEAIKGDMAHGPKSWWFPGLYVELSLYRAQVERYMKTFGEENVLLVLFEDLKTSPRAVYGRIAKHLGIDPRPFETMEVAVVQNSYRTPRFRTAYHLASSVSRGLRHRLLPESVQNWLRTTPLLYGKKKPPLDKEAQLFLQDIFNPDLIGLEQLCGRQFPELRKSWIA